MSNTSYAAVGIPYFFIRFFEKTLLPSMMAAFALGPKHLMPASSSASTQPSTSGSSGATTAKSIPFSVANAVICSISFAPMFTQTASAAMPPFPGSAYMTSTSGFCFIFLMMACSLPPPPTTITFNVYVSFPAASVCVNYPDTSNREFPLELLNAAPFDRAAVLCPSIARRSGLCSDPAGSGAPCDQKISF